MKDYYRILEVSSDADENEIKKAFRKLAKKYHPDTNGGDKQAEKCFQEVNEAYAVLGDSDKRKAYDTKRLGNTHGTAAQNAGAQTKNPKNTRAPRGTFNGFQAGNFKMDFGDMMFEELNSEKKHKVKGQPDFTNVSSQFASFFGFRPR
jgi:molecular chaperone DnaJ